MSDTEKPDISAMSFQEAMTELEGIVRGLESGDIELEASITAYERGTALKRHCEDKLKDAQARIEKISLGPDGAPRAEATQID
jgi:exodeoxyribonuclease VII small subunit